MKKEIVILLGSLMLSGMVSAKEIKMGFAISQPPYVISDEDSGYQVELIREALAAKGHVLKTVYLPEARTKVMFKDKELDAIQHGSDEFKEGVDAFSGERIVSYKDCAITLKKNNIKITKMEDLKNYVVTGFIPAKVVYGKKYADIVSQNKSYTEVGEQVLQDRMLYSGRTQVAVSDINIFNYYAKKIAKSTDPVDKGVDTTQEIECQKIFSDGLNMNSMFNDKQIRDDYNAGVKQIKENGKFEEIRKKYDMII